MLKKELVKQVSALSGESQVLVRRVLEATSAAVITTLAGGSSVLLLGIGKISVHRRNPKKARDMVTGLPVLVPERNVAKLKVSVGLHDAINDLLVSHRA